MQREQLLLWWLGLGPSRWVGVAAARRRSVLSDVLKTGLKNRNILGVAVTSDQKTAVPQMNKLRFDAVCDTPRVMTHGS